MYTSTLTRVEPALKFTISAENLMSSLVPAENNSPDLGMKARLNTNVYFLNQLLL